MTGPPPIGLLSTRTSDLAALVENQRRRVVRDLPALVGRSGDRFEGLEALPRRLARMAEEGEGDDEA